ncbi:MAG: hypothetical protein AAGC92_14225 [Pseudomonadota bacterium]
MQIPENLSGLAPAATAQDGMAAMPGAGMSPQQMPGPQASQQEQENYDAFVSMALMLLFDDESLPSMVEAVDTEDPREGVARLTAQIVGRVAQSASAKGTVFPLDILLQGSAEIFENVVDLAEEAGVYAFSSDPRMLQGALVRAYDHLQQILDQNGLIDDAEIEAGFEEIKAAAANGTLVDSLGVAGADLEPVDPGAALGLDKQEGDAPPPDDAMSGGLG